MNILRSLSVVLGVGCLALGLLGVFGGRPDMGVALIPAGAILIAGVLISSAIADNGGRK